MSLLAQLKLMKINSTATAQPLNLMFLLKTWRGVKNSLNTQSSSLSYKKACQWIKRYKAEQAGSDADLNAYDLIYVAGHANAGGKTIAINLPNDEEVQLKKGTRRLQLKNAMRAKFDAIMTPIADNLIVQEQRRHVTFNAFFANTMFHESGSWLRCQKHY